jgi:tetratricopeptide (TPR) repeat protein
MKRRMTVFLMLLAAGITAAALAPTLTNGFVNLDDNVLVYDNPRIVSLAPDAVRKMFTSFYAGLYHPLVLLSYALEYRFFRLNPAVYHTTNLLLHLANVLLVFWVFLRISRDRRLAFVVALLFGIHPLHVESVAWVSERKDVLYAFFFLAAMGFYVRGAGRLAYRELALAFIAFVCSLLSKPMAVTLPFVLVLLDRMLGLPAGGRRLAVKVPFFAVAGVFTVLTMRGQHAGDAGTLASSFELFKNALVASHGLLFYLGKLICPYPLSCLYPAPIAAGTMPPPALLFAPALLLLGTAAIIFSLRTTRVVLHGFLFYGITVLPVLNLVPVGLGIAADRYTYIPYLGLFYIFAAGALRLWRAAGSRTARTAAGTAGTAVIVVLGLLTWQQSRVWKDDLTLYTALLRHYPAVPIAYNNRGYRYICDNEYDRALADCREAVRLSPDYFDAHNNLGNIYLFKGECDRAEFHFRTALLLRPGSDNMYVGLGNVARRRGRTDEAFRYYGQALALNPRNEKAYYNIGWMREEAGDTDQALAAYGRALAANPRYRTARETRAELLMRCRNYAQAAADYTRLLDAEPANAVLYVRRGAAYGRQGDTARALADLSHALTLQRECGEAYRERAQVYCQCGEYGRALADARAAQRLQCPVDPGLLSRLTGLCGDAS